MGRDVAQFDLFEALQRKNQHLAAKRDLFELNLALGHTSFLPDTHLTGIAPRCSGCRNLRA
jgi:hypothetical protein